MNSNKQTQWNKHASFYNVSSKGPILNKKPRTSGAFKTIVVAIKTT